MESGMTLQVSKNLVEPVIREQIQTAIVRELGNSQVLVKEIVAAALTLKVNSEGKRGRSDYHNKLTYIEWLAKDLIQKAARTAIREYVAEMQAEIQAEVAKQLRKQTSSFAKILVSGLTEAIETSWQFKVDVTFQSE